MTDELQIVDEEQLRMALTIEDALEAARTALRSYSEGKVQIVASVLDLDRGDVHIKGAHAAGGRYFVTKVAGWVPAEGSGRARHGGGSLVCAAESGRPVALLIDQHYLSSLRTAAAGAVAVDLLARSDCRVAGVIGTGVQGRMQTEAILAVRTISKVLLHGRRPEAAEALAAALRGDLGGVEVVVASSVKQVLAEADVVVTATASEAPFIPADWLRPGQHLNAIGADGDGKAELAPECFVRADRVFVDSISQSGATAELGAAIDEGLMVKDEIAGELGDILAGRLSPRRDAGELTIAKMTGIGALDLSIAERGLEKCLA